MQNDLSKATAATLRDIRQAFELKYELVPIWQGEFATSLHLCAVPHEIGNPRAYYERDNKP